MRTIHRTLQLLALLALPGALLADPPSRVARISYYAGTVSFRPAAVDDWARATTTYPLTIGDHLWVDSGARSEIRVGRGSVVRLGPSTGFSFLNLDDQTTQMRLSEGTIAVTVRRFDPDEVVEVDTPNAAVSLLRPGFYLVSVDQQGYETAVTVRDGEVEVMAGGGALPVYEGESIVLSGDDAAPRYDVRQARYADAWENWCLERDRRDARQVSLRYVSDEMVGYEDLDQYGRWRTDPEYGQIWVPLSVSASWAPYRYGRWAYVAPWGWTWIDEAPWGFAPFHYGRWARRDFGWFWVPGNRAIRPVYAPALVAFIGGSDFSVSLSLGGGGIGWFPLGPREVYVPPYRVSPNYMRTVNVAYVPDYDRINVTNYTTTHVTYVNQRIQGAVTAVNSETFLRGRAVQQAAVVVPLTNVQHVKVHAGVVEMMKPQQTSVIGEAAPRAAKTPPVQVQERTVVTRVPPPEHVAPAIPEGPPAHHAKRLVKAVEGGQTPNLKPAREGLPQPREVQKGERPKAQPGERGRGRRQEAPGQQPGTTPQPEPEQQQPRPRERVTPPGQPEKPPEPEAERERGRGRQKQIERERPQEKPPEATPPPPEEQRQKGRGRLIPPPEQPQATPPPEAEQERGRGRQKQIERERPQEKPPEATTPEERRQKPPRERMTPPQPEATPAPEAERGRGRQKDVDRERPQGKPPEATAPPAGNQPPGGRDKGKEKEKKPKGKPTPEPTPTPEGNLLS